MSDNQYMANIGKKIREAREDRGWTQDELAERAGVTQGAIGHAESGRTKRPRDLPEIARALQRDIGWFLDDSDEAYDEWQVNIIHSTIVDQGELRLPRSRSDVEVLSLEGVSSEMRDIIIELKAVDASHDSRRRMLIASIAAMLASSTSDSPKRRR